MFIELKNIEKTYVLDDGSEVKALRGVNLEIEKGEIFGVIGLSGAGKSTLIRIINMLERPTNGSVKVGSYDMTALNDRQLREARRHISMIFQQFNLLSSATVYDNVAFPLRLDRANSKEQIDKRVRELLEMVELSDKAEVYPAQLSGGQKQRVGIARALACEPEILLCDEATSALDPKTTSSILALLRSLREKLGLTIVIITHQMEVIKECCDRVAVIDGGVISEMGPTMEIFANPAFELTKRLVSAAVRKDILDVTEHLKLHENYEDGDSAVTELMFLGEKANDPVIVEVAVETGCAISILAGAINHIQNEPLGIIVTELKGPRGIIEKALSGLKERVYKVTLLGYRKEGE